MTILLKAEFIEPSALPKLPCSTRYEVGKVREMLYVLREVI